MKIDGDDVVLDNGKSLYANNGIIGLSPKGKDGWEVHEGYDGILFMDGLREYHRRHGDDDFSDEELVELADYMIDLWKSFKADYS